ncbi:MAG TPA: hypothetical protein V6C89_20860 [Drouetiella sp.]
MSSTGSHRKGITLIILSLVLTLLGLILPVVLTTLIPTHEVVVVLSGWRALLAEIFFPLMFIMYATGAAQYSNDKGYGKWMGILLALANLPGFLVLLFLPDLKQQQQQLITKT